MERGKNFNKWKKNKKTHDDAREDLNIAKKGKP